MKTLTIIATLAVFPPALSAQSLPEGRGKDAVETICSSCHDAAAAVIGKQWTKPQWDLKVTEMLQEEPDVTQDERAAIVEYLSTFFKPGGKIYINKSASPVLQFALEISLEQADAIVRFRDRNGNFKTAEDMKKVPGLDPAKVESKKDLLIF
jgi:competence protein ComEA